MKIKIEVSNDKGKAHCYCDDNESNEVLIEKTKELMRQLPYSETYDLVVS